MSKILNKLRQILAQQLKYSVVGKNRDGENVIHFNLWSDENGVINFIDINQTKPFNKSLHVKTHDQTFKGPK